jgi:hypothetical protein
MDLKLGKAWKDKEDSPIANTMIHLRLWAATSQKCGASHRDAMRANNLPKQPSKFPPMMLSADTYSYIECI